MKLKTVLNQLLTEASRSLKKSEYDDYIRVARKGYPGALRYAKDNFRLTYMGTNKFSSNPFGESEQWDHEKVLDKLGGGIEYDLDDNTTIIVTKQGAKRGKTSDRFKDNF